MKEKKNNFYDKQYNFKSHISFKNSDKENRIIKLINDLLDNRNKDKEN